MSHSGALHLWTMLLLNLTSRVLFVSLQIYTWPLLQTLLSEVFTREEWLRLFDNVFSNHPSFLLMVVASYSICSRGALLRCTETDDFKVCTCLSYTEILLKL